MQTKLSKYLLIFSLSLYFILPLSFLYAEESSYFKVRRVIDGDTIEIEGGTHVRYIGIDTPETRERTRTGWKYNPQPYAQEASRLNEDLVQDKQVRLEFDVETHDRYGRLLAYVFVGEIFVNEEILRRGYARLLTIPPDVKYVDRFKKAVKKARQHHQGIWE